MKNGKTVNIVAAVADNMALGKNNSLLWHISADMKYFRRLTTGNTVVMGRKTYESIGRPLPKRWNIVITRSTDWCPAQPGNSDADVASGALVSGGFTVVHSLEEALSLPGTSGEIYVLGGGEIYRQAMELADRLYITYVHLNPEADTFFPEISPDIWKEVSRTEPQAEEGIGFEFAVYERIGAKHHS